MTTREAFMAPIRAALEPIEVPAPAPRWRSDLVPSDASGDLESRWAAFEGQLSAVNGTPLRGLEAVGRWLLEKGCRFGYCDPDLLERARGTAAFSGLEVGDVFDRSQVDAYEFGITRASGAITTTGTVILKDGETPARLAALAPWIHVAVVTPAQLHAGIEAALADLGADPSVIWVTGPSKTADVEGILIEGAHGPGLQGVCLDG